jgi:glycosyltransferase involved in cell wall biosynthesis
MLCLQYFGVPWGTRLILTLHGSEILRLHQRPLIRLATARLFSETHRIGVVSRHTRDLLLERFPSSAEKVQLTPGAVRQASLPSTAAPARSRAADAPVVILTVARLHPRKGQLRVIEALSALPPAARGRIEYWIAGAHGKENYDQLLQEAAARSDFPVKFLGDLTDEQLAGVYAQADIFAMTSMPHRQSIEGFGLVYLEAGAHGLPVVAHAIGGVPEAVLDGETGLLVPHDRPAELTAAFARLLGDPDLRRRLGEAGRAHARAHRWDESAQSLFGKPAAAGQTSSS